MKILLSAVIAASLAVPAYNAVACPGKDKKESHAKTTISVDDAAKLASAGKVVMVDANSPETRKKEGVVPGARLLTSYKDFKVSELKASKDDTLVFYCYSEKCKAAPKAAKLAAEKGFSVKVMTDGITGWKKAGHPVKQIGADS